MGRIPRILAALVLAGALTALAAPASAFHCPVSMAKIDKALAEGTDLSDEALSEVKSLRAEGERLHEAGKHAESVKVLLRAMQMLGLIPSPKTMP